MIRRIAAVCSLLIPLLLTACASQTPKQEPTDEPYVGSRDMNNMRSSSAPQPRVTDPAAEPGVGDPGYTSGETLEPAPQAKPRGTAGKPKSTASKTRTYTVKKGDTLSEIAQKQYGDASKWRTIYNANKSKISDPKKLKVGTKLVIP